MNCDEVFQHLTRVRPDGVNGQLDRHLADCESCRALAELFRPAVARFDDCPRDIELSPAAETWHRVWDAVSVAERAADQLRDRSAVVPVAVRSPGWSRGAALLAAGLVLGVLGTMSFAPARGPGTAAEPDRVGAFTTVSPELQHRCEGLMFELQKSAERSVCPACLRPCTTSSFAALCTTCHRSAPGSSESGPPLQGNLLPVTSPSRPTIWFTNDT